MKYKKAESSATIIILLLLLGVGWYFFIYDNGNNNPLKALACSNSGGQWIQGNNLDTNNNLINTYKYCNCDNTKQLTQINEVCVGITQAMKDKCANVPVVGMTCKDENGNCKCNTNDGRVCNFNYATIINAKECEVLDQPMTPGGSICGCTQN